MTFATSARKLRDSMLAVSARDRIARQRTPQRIVLAFHNVLPPAVEDVVGDRSLHLSQRRFCQMLDTLVALPNVSLVSNPLDASRRAERVRVLVTFDDAYRGAVLHGLPEVASRGGAAVVFTAPALLGHDGTWWDRLAPRHARRGERHWSTRRETLLAAPVCGLTDRVEAVERKSLREDRSNLGDASVRALGVASERELTQACADGLTWLACHSFRHACLPSMSASQIRQELELSRGWLADAGAPWLPWHAFPYGRWSNEVVKQLRNLEYVAAFRVEASEREEDEVLLTPRLNVPAGMSADGLVVAIARLLRP